MRLPLNEICADQRAQPRESLKTEITETYAAEMASGKEFPPLVVFHDGETYWLADGFHRRYAAINTGIAELPCEVHRGGLRDAILYSCGANADHGYRRTNEDKRRAVMRLLEDDEWRQWSDREIARQCRVDQSMVSRYRSSLMSDISMDDRTFVHHKTGKPTKMKTGGFKGQKIHHRNSIHVPEGMTAETLCRKAMGIEAAGVTAEEAAKEVSVDTKCYRAMRDIVMLSDRDDLREEDARDVAAALRTLNETNQTIQPHQMIKPLIDRIYGSNKAGPRARVETRRIEQFEYSVRLIVDSCEYFSNSVDVPYLSDDRAKQHINLLKEAERKLRRVRYLITETIS